MIETKFRIDGEVIAQISINWNEDHASTQVHFQSTTQAPPLLDEIKEAINDLKQGKSPGFDGITAEMIKNGGEKVEMFYHKLCTKIWIEKKWPDDRWLSAFVTTVFPLLTAAVFIKFQKFLVRRILEGACVRGRRLYLCQRFITYLRGVGKKNKKQLIFRSFC